MIDLDITMLIQLANFIITLIVLNFLLIGPIRAIIRKRTAAMGELSQEARNFSASAQDKLAGYEASLAEARRDAAIRREEYKLAGVQEEKAIVGAAHEEASGYLDKARAETAAPARSAIEALKGQVKPLAEQAASKILV